MSVSTDSRPLSVGRAPRKQLSRRRAEELMAYLLISPWIIGFVLFILGPMLASFWLSFFETNLFSSEFVALENYSI